MKKILLSLVMLSSILCSGCDRGPSYTITRGIQQSDGTVFFTVDFLFDKISDNTSNSVNEISRYGFDIVSVTPVVESSGFGSRTGGLIVKAKRKTQ